MTQDSGGRLNVYGDFTCPWSRLAWGRTELLADDGLTIDWRTVAHESWHHLTPAGAADRSHSLRDELEEVHRHLLPGEPTSPTVPPFVPFTSVAASAYAEAYAADVARAARRVLFEAYWHDGVDLGDPRTVRGLLVDVLRGSTTRSEQVRLWGHSVDITGGPLTSAAWHLVRDWRSQWDALGHIVPIVVESGPGPQRVHLGKAAVDWLGEALRTRGLDRWEPAHHLGEHPGEHPAA